MPVKLILTHDNADFDAVASLLAAHKLDPEALPVLPKRVNRNVEEFLTLYGSELPFVRRGELKRGGPVERVTVVDTQSFSTARGMRPDTPVHFIDHHPLARDLEPNQTFAGEPVGAATTLLVEQIHEQGDRSGPRWKPLCCCWVSTKTPARCSMARLPPAMLAVPPGCWSAGPTWT